MARQGRPGHTEEPSRWPWMFWARQPACIKEKGQVAEEPAQRLPRFQKRRPAPAHASARTPKGATRKAKGSPTGVLGSEAAQDLC